MVKISWLTSDEQQHKESKLNRERARPFRGMTVRENRDGILKTSNSKHSQGNGWKSLVLFNELQNFGCGTIPEIDGVHTTANTMV